MLDTVAFIKRVEIIFDHYAINAALFAEQIGVQRSSLSHLLSGRNKPSLDFILKIVATYPEVDLNWIINGRGSFPVENEIKQPILNRSENASLESKPTISDKNNNIQSNLFDNQIIESVVKSQNTEKIDNNEIDKIIFFYKNGDFKIYNPK